MPKKGLINTSMLKKNDKINITIEAMSSEGLGVGRYLGFVVFVPYSAPGDVADIHITKVSKNHAYGKIESLIKAAECRVSVDCEAFFKCGGCSYRHIDYQSELQIKLTKVREALSRIGKINLEPSLIVPSPKLVGYRNKSQLPFGLTDKGEICLGFYAKRSHRIIKISKCYLTPDFFADIQKTILEFANSHKISVYNEETKKGLLRHLYIRYGESSGEIMVCLVLNGKNLPHERDLVNLLTQKFPKIKSIVININEKNTNLIMGDENKLLYGNEYITDTLCGIKVKISPHSFYQVNSSATALLYETAKDMASLKGSEALMDLYCGIGIIGLFFAKDCKGVIGVESMKKAVEDANYNAELNGVDNAKFVCGNASDFENFSEKPDILVLDPPRKGCDISLIESVVKISPGRIIYISCDPATLSRDLKLLAERGYYPDEVRVVDLFPRTWHTECVVSISPKKQLEI